jgi:hypothetical protein
MGSSQSGSWSQAGRDQTPATGDTGINTTVPNPNGGSDKASMAGRGVRNNAMFAYRSEQINDLILPVSGPSRCLRTAATHSRLPDRTSVEARGRLRQEDAEIPAMAELLIREEIRMTNCGGVDHQQWG